ncbi:MAG: aspartate aminotransferase [Candidatus [Bacteroides] periocalifornicus]|uniref:Aspartate aminotransferase n=1 Tax=Candidatus [Bacteroides] periocalifornicus TaxID=1702214 RepID=A0A0Q4B3U4_9BACT|nr:MAG: aspartate aminotransferase [Candidatus [Bacteroides] periocalifornicus]
MLTVSQRATVLPASPIRRLVPYANAAKARGTKVYHLNIGQPDIATPECALQAVRENRVQVVSYTDSAGNLSYREGLVEYYKKLGIGLEPRDIIVTQGGSEAILFAFLGCMDPGDEVLIPEPFYANYNGFAQEAGIKVVPIPSSIENDFALPPVEEFERRITPRTRAIMICNPNNPTGYLYSQGEIEQLGAIASRYDLYILADEVYREFCYDGHKHFSVMQLRGLEDRTILMDSVSKRYSLCGVRVGAFICRNRELVAAVLKYAQARLCPGTYSQMAAEAALKAPESYFKQVYDEYVARRNFMVNALNAMPGVYSPMPKGAFYTQVRLPLHDADAFALWLLEEFEYQGQTVMIAPASGFYATPGLGKDEARLAYVLKIEDLRAAMETLAVALKRYTGR